MEEWIIQIKKPNPVEARYKVTDEEECMEEWKELDIANLPGDILVGDYEFGWLKKDGDIGVYNDTFPRSSVIAHLANEPDYEGDVARECTRFYRKRQKKQPTHEEQCKKLAYKIKNGQRISDIVNAVLYLLEKDIKEPS